MFSVFFILGVYQDIIQINHDKLVEVFHEYIVHQSRKGGWGICQAKGHDGVLVRTIASNKGGLRNVLITDSDLVITQPQVEFRNHLCSGKLIIQIIDPGKWIHVLDGGLVDRSVILDQTVCTITFLDKERRCSPS